jgi:hypothetical protein
LHKSQGYLDCISCIKARNCDNNDYWSIEEDLTALLNMMDSYYSADNINANYLGALFDVYAWKVKATIIAELDKIIKEVMVNECRTKM